MLLYSATVDFVVVMGLLIFTLATNRPITIIIKFIENKKKEFANHIKIISQQKYVSKKMK